MSTSIETLEGGSDAGNRSTRPPEVVYFTAAVGMLGDPLYDRALPKVQGLHPSAKMLSAKSLWSSPKDWLATYREALADVTHVYILPYKGGIVGAGIYEEIDYLDSRDRGAPYVRFFDHSLNLNDLDGFLRLANPTKGRFARLCSESQARALGIEKTPSQPNHSKPKRTTAKN